jgi:HK97 family phage portal protein
MRSPVGTLTRSIRNSSSDTPVEYVGSRSSGILGGIGGAPTSNVAGLLGATKLSGTCYSAVRVISNGVAQVEWKLYRKAATGRTSYGDDSNREEVPSHLALDVLNHPNPFMTRQELFEAGGQHGEIIGETWCVFGNNGQPNGMGGYVPSSIWLVSPDKMAPNPSPKKFIDGYTYSGPDGDKITLSNDEVMMLRVPDPQNPFRGLGWVRAILTMLDSEKYSAEWNRNFFINSAEPGGVVQVGDSTNRIRLTDPEWDEFQKRWRETHRGVSNAHRIAMLENGMQWVANANSHREMQFVELRTASRDAVLEASGLPGSMIGISEHVNKANAQTGEVTFARWIARDRLVRWRDALNNDFLPLFGRTAAGLEFDYIDPTPTDDAAEVAAMYSRVQSWALGVGGGLDSDQMLETVGLPPMAWTKPATPAPSFHFGTPPGSDPAKPEGQPNEADSEEMANA